MATASFKIDVKGHVQIKDGITGEILLDKDNAVHNKHMATAIARGLANDTAQQIYQMRFGNGGSTVNTSNQITYQAPNVTGATANLYNMTYSEIVDEANVGAGVGNSVTYQVNADPATTSIVIVSCTIAAGEPAGQGTSDTGDTNPDSTYAFDELGLFTSDGLLLTHIIFSPILKTSNRELVITYTLTVSVA